VDGVSFDTGPSVLTMPEVLGELLELGGMRLGEELRLRAPDPAFRYRWPDGLVLDLHPELERSLEAVRAALGAGPAEELRSFLEGAGRIWAAAAPHFVLGPAPSWTRLVRLPLGELWKMRQLDSLRSMARSIEAQVREPHLQDLLLRYATYNGSDPRRAPATLNCIAHVELALGGFGLEGGVGAMVAALVEAGARRGVQLELGCPVEGVEQAPSGYVVKLAGGRAAVDALVVNAEPSWLAKQLPGALRAPPSSSTSGWTGVYRARRRARPAHEVLFPRRYMAEFEDLFDAQRPPLEPAVYLCAQEVQHGRAGWADAEPLFAMVNAPPEPPGGSEAALWSEVEGRCHARLVDAGLVEAEDALVWRRSPSELARAFPGSRGGLYGAASNGTFDAFLRPANRLRRGLYLASGGAHPGGGMPLAMRSGLAAASALLAET
jgi:phytoene dehydrogenase-like protein